MEWWFYLLVYALTAGIIAAETDVEPFPPPRGPETTAQLVKATVLYVYVLPAICVTVPLLNALDGVRGGGRA